MENSTRHDSLQESIMLSASIIVTSEKQSLKYYPNACIICRVTISLKRCSNCNMVSYCGLDHQKEHWPIHKDLCKGITAMKNAYNLSHILEDLRGVDVFKWSRERKFRIKLIENFIDRKLIQTERELFIFPRACFLCHDTRQSRLINCSGCPSTSFCTDHPRSSIHDQDCALIKYAHDFELDLYKTSSTEKLSAIRKIVDKTRIDKSSKVPSSMKQYLDNQIKPGVQISECLKIYATEFLSKSLTIFNAHKKLNRLSVSKLLVHVAGGGDFSTEYMKAYEALLHFLPDLKVLKIYIAEQDHVLKVGIEFCNQCRYQKKKLIVECSGMVYMAYIAKKNYEKPDIVVFYSQEHPEHDMFNREVWGKFLKFLKDITCPIVFTTYTDIKGKFIANSFRNSYWSYLMCYEGPNDFGSLRPLLDWAAGRIGSADQFFFVTESRDGQRETDEVTDKEGKSVKVTEGKKRSKKTTETQESDSKPGIKKPESKAECGIKELESKVEAVDENLNPKAETTTKDQESTTKRETKGLESRTKSATKGLKLKIEPATGNIQSKIETAPVKDELLTEYFLLEEENRLLKENLDLKEESRKLKKERLREQQENEQLQKENQMIKEFQHTFNLN